MKRGEVWLAKIPKKKDGKTYVQYGDRAIIIVSNEFENKHSPIIKAVPVTKNLEKAKLPTHINVGRDCGLLLDSIALIEQTQTINKTDLLHKVGDCTDVVMNRINVALLIEYGLMHMIEREHLIVC